MRVKCLCFRNEGKQKKNQSAGLKERQGTHKDWRVCERGETVKARCGRNGKRSWGVVQAAAGEQRKKSQSWTQKKLQQLGGKDKKSARGCCKGEAKDKRLRKTQVST